MSTYGHGDDWDSPLILKPVAAPPPDLIEAPGGRLVTVNTPRGTSPAQHHPGVLLAWARIPGGSTWATLMVWGGWRRASEDPARRRDLRPSARWSWVRYEPAQVGRLNPWLPDQNPGLRWFGRHSGSDFEAAYLQAAASLPGHMRESALEFTEDLGPAWP